MNSPILILCFISATFSACATSWLEKSNFWSVKPKYVDKKKCENFDFLKKEIVQIQREMSNMKEEMKLNRCNKKGQVYFVIYAE